MKEWNLPRGWLTGQAKLIEAIDANERAIKTQVASKYSFEQLIHRIKMGNPS